ncbi:MAG: hypothetical protein ACK549_11060, partial [Cyanobacteriota bacterium]
LGPCRRRLVVGPDWRVLGPIDGLHNPAGGGMGPPDGDGIDNEGETRPVLPPWSLSFLRLRVSLLGRQMDR